MMAGHNIRRMLLTLLTLTALAGGLFEAGTVAAAPGPAVAVSSGVGPNTHPALAISPDNTRLCVVWNTFDKSPDAYARIYNFAARSWSAIVNLSQNPGENTLAVRCAIDAAGNIHVAWSEGASKRIQYRRLDAGRDPGSIGNWSGITTISRETDAQWSDTVAMSADPTGRAWIAYSSGGKAIFVRSISGAGAVGEAARVSDSDGHFPRIGVDDAGYVHVIYKGSGARYTYRDKDRGQWTRSVELPSGSRALPQMGLVVDRRAIASYS